MTKRLFSILLCVALVFTMLPNVFAANTTAAGNDIDFTDPAEASKFEVIGGTAAIAEGTGLALVTTRNAIETCNGQNSGTQATTPEDLVQIEVSGDWIATLEVDFATNSARNGYYQFFGFFAAASDEYGTTDMAGIRGGDGAMQNFTRLNGTIDADNNNSTPGFATEGTYFLRLEKQGTTYICSRSDDGETFSEMFTYEDTDIDAEYIFIDAYTGMTTGYKFTLKYLALEGDGGDGLDRKGLRSALRQGKAIDKRWYTEASYAALTAALEAGQTALAEATTQAALDKAAADILAAIEGLVKSDDLPMMYVTFNYNFPGAPDPVTVEVEMGSTVEPLPLDGVRKGYAGTWRRGNSNFNFNTAIEEDITLTANWSKDWNQMWSLPKEYEGLFSFGNFGTMSPGSGQTEVEYSTYSGNNGKMTYNFDANASRNDPEGKVHVSLNGQLTNSLNSIRNWNNNHPDGPKKYYRQHVLFWHGSEQNAAFYHEGFDTSKPLASREVMNQRIDQYVEAMFRACLQWDDVILSWDVVNEALDDFHGMVRNGWNGSGWGETSNDDASSQSSAWGTIYRMYKDADGKVVEVQLGSNGRPVAGTTATAESEFSYERLMYESEWIRVAFASARKWQKELGAHWKLYYNDYMNSNMVYEPKMSNTIKVLQPIYEAGNIDGYGMQARLAYAYPTVDMLRNQIELGLTVADEVSFSEADIRSDFEPNPKYDPLVPTRRVQQGDEEYSQGGSGSWNQRSQNNGNTYDVFNSRVRRKNGFSNNNIDDASKKAQADLWADLVDIMIEKAAEGKVGAIAVDGTSDSNTFNGGTGCQIWDTSGNEKPAFFALVGAPNRWKMGLAIKKGPAKTEEANYTAETWAPYVAALDAATALVDVRIYDDAGVQAVVKATEALNAAIDALKLKTGVTLDKTALTKAIADGKAVDADKYDAFTVNDVNNYVAAGEAVAAAPVSQNQINNAAADIAAAMDKLVLKGETRKYYRNTEALDAAIAEAEALNANDWSEDSWAVLADVLAEAKDVLENEFAQEFFDIAALKIEAAQAKLVAANPDALKTNALKAAIKTAEELDEDKYTPESFAKIAAPLAAAKKALEEAKTQGEIDSAEQALTAAINGLVEKAPELNKTALEAAIAEGDKLVEAEYTAASWKTFADALAAAKKAKDEAKTQDEIDAATAALTAAIAGLVKEVPGLDKTKLEAAVAAADELKEDDYTAETWAPFAEALAAAKTALNDAKTQDEINAAEAALTDAQGKLEKKPDDKFEFDDVKDPEKFYYEPVYWAVNHDPQVTNGATPTTFNPDGACTRGHVVTFLWRAAGEPEPTATTTPFTDLKESAFYYKAVIWAVENGITTGASKTTFAPGKPCTRGQIVTFLWRFKNSPEPKSTENPFGDVDAEAFYYKAVLWAVENNVTSGTGKGKFSPNSTCTRGQVVTFLFRASGE